MRNLSQVLVPALLFLNAGLSSAADKVELGLNDVSVLLPYNEQPKLFEQAPTIESFVSQDILLGIDKALTDSSEFSPDQLSVFFKNGKQEFFRYRMVSFRVDPCANKISLKGDFSKCRPEFRVVWQRHDSGRTQFEDNNIHAIHFVSQSEFKDIVATLRQIKATSTLDTQSLPLSPNPVIAKEGLESEYYKGMMGLVAKYARPDNLKEVAFLAETNQGGHWPMLKLEVNGNENHVIKIPGTEKDENGKDFFVQRMDGRAELEEPLPRGNTKHNLFSSRDDAALVKNAFAIEKPSLHSAADTDCASCHRADQERGRVMENNPGLEVPSDIFRSKKWNLTNVTKGRQIQSLQVFSYFNTDVRIMPRTINETADVADFINEHY